LWSKTLCKRKNIRNPLIRSFKKQKYLTKRSKRRLIKMVQGLCMGCRQKNKNDARREMKNAKISQTARGGYMAKGECVKCGTRMAAMMSKDNAEKAISAGEAEKDF
jgi:coenzyme F420-reducing hydrogenase gamma subunit